LLPTFAFLPTYSSPAADSPVHHGERRQATHMLTFTITDEERRRAQDRAAELDLDKSHPPGQHPFMWDNRMDSVIRWYNYGSRENKIGVIYFERIDTSDRQKSGPEAIRCTTELFHRPSASGRDPQQTKITDPDEHQRLQAFFTDELLGGSE
jgi:hypothetical protein